MRLVIDVGNTNTVIGVFAGAELRAHWRIETKRNRTADEYALTLRQLLELDGIDSPSFTAVAIASVVPSTLFPLEDACRRRLDLTPLIVGPGIKTGMPILTDNPREVGADRIVNSVAAYERIKGEVGGENGPPGSIPGCIVVDFGTATTFDVVSPKGEYLGGVITPGITVSAEALYHAASKLPRVEIVRPPRVIGKNTIASMQSGLLFGYAGLVDAIVGRMKKELDFPARCLATGGLAPLVAKESQVIEEVDELLTLRGLAILIDRNV